MLPSTARRHQRVPRSTIWAAAAAALVLHGALLGTVSVFGSDLVGGGFVTRVPDPIAAATAPEDIELYTSCTGDVLLATGARLVGCALSDDPESCVGEKTTYMWMDMSSCAAPTDAVAVASLADARQLQRVTPIDPEKLIEELAALEQQKPPPPPPPPQPQVQAPPPPPPPPPAPRKPQQVVETAKPDKEEEPDPNARFLAEHSTKAKKETVARGARNEPMVAKSKPEELEAKDKPKDDPAMAKAPDKEPGKHDKAPDVPGKLAMRPPGAPTAAQEEQEAKQRGASGGSKEPIVADGFIPRRGDQAVEQQRRDPGEKTNGQNGAGGGSPTLPDLRPSKEVLERALGGGSVDHLEQVESGDETALSAKRWVYASFFNRLKRQVAQNWDPQTVWRRTDPQGTHHGFKTRITEVRVSLTSKGDLKSIVVTSGSEVKELDEEAVRAFQAAAPFPNPPEGLVQRDSLITFAFSFYFEIGAPRTSWRVIKQ